MAKRASATVAGETGSKESAGDPGRVWGRNTGADGAAFPGRDAAGGDCLPERGLTEGQRREGIASNAGCGAFPVTASDSERLSIAPTPNA